MAGSVNKVILIGNLGRDPETRYTTGGDAIANLNIATTEQWKDKSGEKQEKTEWHNIVMWRGLAEVAETLTLVPGSNWRSRSPHSFT